MADKLSLKDAFQHFSTQQNALDANLTSLGTRVPPTGLGQTRILTANQVRKSYPIGGEKRSVLDGVNFYADSGECVFLSGPSGSGKSTLLSIMGCLLESDSGEVTIAEHRVDQMNVQERTKVRRNYIGFVFQRFQLIRGISAEDNVAVPLTLQGHSLADARTRSAELLKRVGLEFHRHHLPSAMSPGQCQRVALARAVITSPNLILADEPTAALDGKSGQEVMELLKELIADTNSATVVVTHDPRIIKYADRICEIENGQFK
ncbi:Macrolide export ATP-binding/permease protein MacB [Rubripirellula amarantea]|uniref:Macrolide export ATP-binding/permease protein MacB n=1 Tax=Rubripirellula amarantea TaxID=2527999 RepID=A0A5C5WWQ0_9BACT|nr:ABC transporter ATP-binding protein [Rubripirellula amarantea]TWT54649.1 Macrolide export ATP-binding/permease protein MacB [Rubripirellula amarantea]